MLNDDVTNVHVCVAMVTFFFYCSGFDAADLRGSC